MFLEAVFTKKDRGAEIDSKLLIESSIGKFSVEYELRMRLESKGQRNSVVRKMPLNTFFTEKGLLSQDIFVDKLDDMYDALVVQKKE